MRTYGRTQDILTKKLTWREVTTGPDGSQDYIWVTTLIQTLKLNLGESPFYANYGIPAKQSVQQQIAPDFFVARTQQQYSQYFASLIIAKTAAGPAFPPGTPTYSVFITTHQGVTIPPIVLSFGVPK